jgi:hypothetical protein
VKPAIDGTKFGSITINGVKYEHDVIIRLSGKVEGRKKALSRQVFGTSHTISLAEAEDIYEAGAEAIIVGTGQSGMAKLSREATAFFETKHCAVKAAPTPDAVHDWNEAGAPAVGLFHVTC